MKTGAAIWFTGLPGSGKSSVARAVAEALRSAGHPLTLLQMDARRKVYFPVASYTEDEREAAYHMFAGDAAGLVREGRLVLMDATGNRKRWRDHARERIPRFAEVFVSCPVKAAMAREAARPDGLVMAGLYAKALHRKATGEAIPGLGEVIGVDVPFEEDPAAECVVDTGVLTVEQARDEVLRFLGSWL
ncbi:adenylyl-sulfate kinase [Desulfolutivibrio sulfoxidireducens]|uniref:adenylyl-sulfate kinase n=1 Tax=Desulfolutivibrio sulfoxidireducens TaxID=2773299 RepID=UPI00159D5787|nr:adenylyl-sulfate kinase [Desulfolutivibrio sulfoxidireducens]QLA15826.1 adenylyl-sulfate kinase [Desulfolutivibrio sulfoxidireducens]QLA20272.1 adenylyl-sulfate kinase [Desulfolutivibrio sulfoxidireducens]